MLWSLEVHGSRKALQSYVLERTLGDFDVKMTVKPGVISIVPEAFSAHHRRERVRTGCGSCEVRSVEVDAGQILRTKRQLPAHTCLHAVIMLPVMKGSRFKQNEQGDNYGTATHAA